MTIIKYLSVAVVCGLAAGCANTRSISNAGNQKGGSHYACWRVDGSDPAFDYRGELNEFDVLGITRGEATSEAEIQRTLDVAKPIKLNSGSSILLIQSGAVFPDGGMVTALSKTFRVAPFSGVPPVERESTGRPLGRVDAPAFARSLRLAAARGGNECILCYWGVLESESEHLPTKAVSWVPVVNWLLPDQTLHTRIRLKLALVDVRSGNWTVFSAAPFQDNRITTSPHRAAADQKQVERLKQKAYEQSVQELLKLCS